MVELLPSWWLQQAAPELKKLSMFSEFIGTLGSSPGLARDAVIETARLVRILGDRRLFRRFNYYCIYLIYGQLLFLADWWSGSEVRIFSAMAREVQGRESALIIMNHHYELDWLYCWMIADRVGVVGNCRAFIKDSLTDECTSHRALTHHCSNICIFCHSHSCFDPNLSILI